MHSIQFQARHDYSKTRGGITVPIELGYGLEWIRLDAKIDTGAEFCLFERGYGEALGINIEVGDEKRLSTLSGAIVAFGHEVSLRVLGLEFPLVAFFPQDASIHRSLLGRQGWLRQVRLGLVDYDQMIYLSRYDN
jgi:hypothetical protein